MNQATPEQIQTLDAIGDGLTSRTDHKALLIVLPNTRPISWNQLYKGQHWSWRNMVVQSTHDAVRAALIDMGIHPQDRTKLFDKPVDITTTAYFDRQPMDADNIADKLYIDALKQMVIYDDNPHYVASAKTVSRMDREKPRVEIELEEVN